VPGGREGGVNIRTKDQRIEGRKVAMKEKKR